MSSLMDRKAEFIADLRSKSDLRENWISWSMEDRFQYLKARFPEFSDQEAVQVYLYKDLKPSGDPKADGAALDVEIGKAEDGKPTAFWG